jgi:hypothetical protein
MKGVSNNQKKLGLLSHILVPISFSEHAKVRAKISGFENVTTLLAGTAPTK